MLAALLGAFFLFAPAPASAQTTVWSATLTPGTITSEANGCFTGFPNVSCDETAVLTDDDFSHGGRDHTIAQLLLSPITGELIIVLATGQNWDSLGNLTLHVDSSTFAVADAGTSSSEPGRRFWPNSGLTWTVGQSVAVKLTEPSYALSVEATPPCGSEVTNLSVQPSYVLVLDPAPAADTIVESRWVAADGPAGYWRETPPAIKSSDGRSNRTARNSFAKLRNLHPGFKGFKFRHPSDRTVTAECLWEFSEQTSRDDMPADPPSRNTGGTTTGGGGGGFGGGGNEPPPEDEEPTASCPREDRETLVSFYEMTDGENWNENEDWNSEEPLGEWHGIKTDEDGNVVYLRLSDNNLSGDMPTEELLCLTELVELALWGNDDLEGEVPEELVLAVERAALRYIAEMLNINPEWFEDYGDPYDFEDWHEGVTTDDDGRVTGLDFTEERVTGEIPENIFELLPRLGEIMVTRSSGDGGCAVGASSERMGASALLAVILILLAVSRGLRERSD